MPKGLVKEPRHTEHLSEGNASCSSVFTNSNNAKSIGSPIWKECDDVMVHTRFADGVRINHKSRANRLSKGGGTGGMDYDGEMIRIRHPIRSEPSSTFQWLLRACFQRVAPSVDTHQFRSKIFQSSMQFCQHYSSNTAVEITRRAH